MLTLSIIILLSFIISLIIIILAIRLGEKSLKEREKITPFECGFSPFKKARRPFSLRFFIVTLIFLIFDIEIALLLPLGLITKITNFTITSLVGLLVVFILVGGLLHEWKQGALNWVE